VGWEYHEEIKSLRGPEEPSLSSLATVSLSVGSKVEIVIEGQGQEYRLSAGPVDPDDPGHVSPNDYTTVTNNKHWERTG
jgi:hypothetical protein